MGLLFVGALAGILISLAWFAPSQGYSGYASRLYVDEVGSGRPLEPRPAALVPGAFDRQSDARIFDRVQQEIVCEEALTGQARQEHACSNEDRGYRPSDRPVDLPDSVLSKAKATIAAKMEDPGSAEFGDMKRAMRKNTFGHLRGSICGHVKEKTASGEKPERDRFYIS